MDRTTRDKTKLTNHEELLHISLFGEFSEISSPLIVDHEISNNFMRGTSNRICQNMF